MASTTPSVADIIRYYSRRIMGEAFTQTSRALEQSEGLKSLFGSDQDGGKQFILELLERHRQRLDRLGIEPLGRRLIRPGRVSPSGSRTASTRLTSPARSGLRAPLDEAEGVPGLAARHQQQVGPLATRMLTTPVARLRPALIELGVSTRRPSPRQHHLAGGARAAGASRRSATARERSVDAGVVGGHQPGVSEADACVPSWTRAGSSAADRLGVTAGSGAAARPAASDGDQGAALGGGLRANQASRDQHERQDAGHRQRAAGDVTEPPCPMNSVWPGHGHGRARTARSSPGIGRAPGRGLRRFARFRRWRTG